MAEHVARIVGGAGTGKTTRLIQTMEKLIHRGDVDIYQIGFVSFTRAARSEAADRAASVFGHKAKDLEQGGWFRTLHSICHRQLCVGKELLTGEGPDQKWIAEAIGEEVAGENTSDLASDFTERKQMTSADKALSLWDVSRNKLEPLRQTWERAEAVDWSAPSWDEVSRVVERYETAKQLAYRLDFTDLCGRFAGWEFGVHEHTEVAPYGEVPDVPVWFLDEQQDTSALLDSVCRRLTEPARFVYICLDPFQAIYSFAGASSKHAMAWDVSEKNQHVLRQSRRCPSKILELGESILSGCTDYWDRKILPVRDGGEIERTWWDSDWESQIDPCEKTILIARTNRHAARIARRLDKKGIPWLPTRGNGRWNMPSTSMGLAGLYNLHTGGVCTSEQWAAAVKILPSKLSEREFLERGTKRRWSKREVGRDESLDVSGLSAWGATPHLIEYIKSGQWQNIIGGNIAYDYTAARQEWGYDAVHNPKISVGTIHSVKGAEAQSVMVLTTTSSRIQAGINDIDIADEERRIAYVAATRSENRLMIVSEDTHMRMEI